MMNELQRHYMGSVKLSIAFVSVIWGLIGYALFFC